MAENCSDTSDWSGIGHIWWHLRGMEDASIDAELIDVSSAAARLKVRTSWGVTDDAIINKGSYETYTEPNGIVWRVYCTDVSYSMAMANVKICYDEEEPDPDPDPELCSDHTTQVECSAAGCFWYDNACHGTPMPDPDPDPEPDPEDGWIREGQTTTIFGQEFGISEIMCDIAGAVVSVVKDPSLVDGTLDGLHLIRKTLFVGAAATVIATKTLTNPLSGLTTSVIMGRMYMKLVDIDDSCENAQLKVWEDTYTPEDHDNVVDKIIDEIEDDGFTVGDGDDDDFTQEEVDTAVSQAEEEVAQSDEERDRQDKVATGEMTPEEAKAEREEQIANRATTILFEGKFSIEVPSFVMAGDVEISGIAPIKFLDIDVVVESSWLILLTKDTVVGSFTSGEDRKFSGTINLDSFGSTTLKGRIKKDLLGIDLLAKDVYTEDKTVWVLTWEIVIALLLAIGLILEKKYNKLGIFKR